MQALGRVKALGIFHISLCSEDGSEGFLGGYFSKHLESFGANNAGSSAHRRLPRNPPPDLSLLLSCAGVGLRDRES